METKEIMIDTQIIEEAKQKLVAQDKEGVVKITRQVIEAGHNPLDLMNQAFIPGINEVGNLFGRGQLFLPELMLAADAMKAVTELVNAHIQGGEAAARAVGKVLIATVKGDVHDIGKAIVVSLMRANGFDVYDETSPGRGNGFTSSKKAVEIGVDVIGTSALLTTTMSEQKKLEEALKSMGLRDRFKTVVGGAPVTPRWAARIGADAYAEDAQGWCGQNQGTVGLERSLRGRRRPRPAARRPEHHARVTPAGGGTVSAGGGRSGSGRLGAYPGCEPRQDLRGNGQGRVQRQQHHEHPQKPEGQHGDDPEPTVLGNGHRRFVALGEQGDLVPLADIEILDPVFARLYFPNPQRVGGILERLPIEPDNIGNGPGIGEDTQAIVFRHRAPVRHDRRAQELLGHGRPSGQHPRKHYKANDTLHGAISSRSISGTWK